MASQGRLKFDGRLQVAQFTDQNNSDAGGASIHPTSLNIPQIGEHGWMVGGHPDTAGNRIPETYASSPMTAVEAAAHIKRVAGLTGGDPDGFAGSWVDEGRTVLDASTRIRTRKDAVTEGDARGEDSIFGFRHGTTVRLKAGRAKDRAARKLVKQNG